MGATVQGLIWDCYARNVLPGYLVMSVESIAKLDAEAGPGLIYDLVESRYSFWGIPIILANIPDVAVGTDSFPDGLLLSAAHHATIEKSEPA